MIRGRVEKVIAAVAIMTLIFGAGLSTASAQDPDAPPTTEVASRVELFKTTDGVVDPTFDWQFAIYDGPDGYNSGALATDSSFGDGDGVLDFGGFDFDPNGSYTICELNTGATAGWTQVWTLNRVMIDPYNPDADAVPREDNGVRCYDFSFNTGGENVLFAVDNIRPSGGDARTPGYWKNWSSCSNGDQYEKATADDPADEFTALDELLADPAFSFVIGLLDLSDPDGAIPAATCEAAGNILDQREIDGRNRNRANDAAYKLARNLLAYELNIAAGAAPNATAAAAATEGHALLVAIGFDGTGQFLRPRDALHSDAIDLAEILDLYNNNLLP